MKKWTFWTAMCLTSILNGMIFFAASLNSMRHGIDGADNQAALLFIPMLWIAAGLVLIGLNGYTLIRGISMEKGQTFCVSAVFKLSGLSGRTKAERISLFVGTGLLMLFGYCLFAAETVLSIAYALSGGALLLLLYTWNMQSFARRHIS